MHKNECDISYYVDNSSKNNKINLLSEQFKSQSRLLDIVERIILLYGLEKKNKIIVWYSMTDSEIY